MMRGALISILSSAWTVALLQQSQPSKPEQLPTFRTGIDIVEVDVTVLDKDRHPVKGLTAADFTILDRGKPQPIVAFSAVDVPAPVTYSAPWMREAPLDVVSNVENRRLVTIVMDDAYTDFNPDMAKRAKAIARNAVDELGPADLAAIVFTFMGRSQNFTSDRSRLLAAIDSYIPRKRNGEPPLPCWGPTIAARGMPPRRGGTGTRKCDTDTLRTVAQALSTAAPGRKIVIFVSGGRTFSFDMENEAADLSKLFRDLQAANITVYAFDARGLTAPNMSMANQLPDPASSTLDENESLYTFAANTGGRTIANTNDPQSHVGETFRESSNYYFIGFRAALDSSDNGLRKVEVRVNRPDVEVRTRRGYYPPGKKLAPREVTNGLPNGELPVQATATVVAVPGRRDAEVILGVRIGIPLATATPTAIELAATAVDLDGKPNGIQRQRITLTPTESSNTTPDMSTHLPLAPGRYMIQISGLSEGRAGSAILDVDVPNFAKEPLAASGLMLQERPLAAVSDKALAALIPFTPTTRRQFHTDDDVAVFLRIYQGGKDRIVPVRVSASVKNEQNAVASNYDSTLAVTNFSEARSADYELSLPLARLSPGEYLLEVDAQSGARHVIRTARFSVVK
jgi:VWFA-related protein